MKTMVFDIETVPDVASGRRILNLEGLPDAEVAKIQRSANFQKGVPAPARSRGR